MSLVLTALTLLVSGGVGSLLLARWRSAGLAVGLAAGAGACLVCIWGALLRLGGPGSEITRVYWRLPLGEFRLALDGLSAWFLLMIGVVGLAASVYSWGYYGRGTHKDANRAYPPLFCTLLAAMVLTVCAGDALVFLIGWEFTSLSAFFLVGLNDEDPLARNGAWTYLIATHLGTALGVFPVMAAFVARTGVTGMEHFSGAFTAGESAACVGLFVLGVAGFGTKAGFVPFHVWLPLAHPVAPSPVSALMSGVVIKMGVYGLLRMLSWLPDLPVYCGVGLLILSAVTGLVGILNALGQRDLKKMLAYSSVENMGIVGMGISVALMGRSLQMPALIVCGLGGALLHALNHAIFKGLLFLSAGAVLHGTGTVDMERLGGLAKRGQVASLAFLTGALAICALPPLNGFLSEYLIYGGLIRGIGTLSPVHAAPLGAAVGALALIGALALAVFSKAFSSVFLGQPKDAGIVMHPTPSTMNAGMLLLAAACVLVVPMAGRLLSSPGLAMEAWLPRAAASPQAAGAYLAPLQAPMMVLLMVALLLWGLRLRLPQGGRNTTWACGYSQPTSAMQYTGSSYGWTLLSAFRTLVRPRRHMTAPGVECFPRQTRLETLQTDLALERIFRPSFAGMARFLERLWPLQHGRIQLYLLYIVGTILVVFLVEAWLMPFHVENVPPTAVVEAGRPPVNAVGAGAVR